MVFGRSKSAAFTHRGLRPKHEEAARSARSRSTETTIWWRITRRIVMKTVVVAVVHPTTGWSALPRTYLRGGA